MAKQFVTLVLPRQKTGKTKAAPAAGGAAFDNFDDDIHNRFRIYQE
jgi:hypothetical protein